MIIGSIVECLRGGLDREPYPFEEGRLILPEKGRLYVVRNVRRDQDGTSLLFEEIVNPTLFYPGYGFYELAFDASKFLELQKPWEVNLGRLLAECFKR